jgi:hypothetical protein
LKAVNAEANDRMLIVVEDWYQCQGSRTLLRLPAPPLHLVAGPVQLFQAVLAAHEVCCDDNEHYAGTTQGRLHLLRRIIAVPAIHLRMPHPRVI